MELIGKDRCPFDWDFSTDKVNGTPPKTLQGGRLLAICGDSYAYGYFDDTTGDFTGALFLPKRHLLLAEILTGPCFGELGRLYHHVQHELGLFTGGNISFNDGYDAGQRFDHGHGHGIPRQSGRPSTGMGLKMLTARFDSLVSTTQQALDLAVKL